MWPKKQKWQLTDIFFATKASTKEKHFSHSTEFRFQVLNQICLSPTFGDSSLPTDLAARGLLQNRTSSIDRRNSFGLGTISSLLAAILMFKRLEAQGGRGLGK